MIDRIMHDDALYARVSAAAREQLYLDWDTVVDGVYEKYLEIIEAKKQDVESKKLSNRLRQAFLPDFDNMDLTPKA